MPASRQTPRIIMKFGRDAQAAPTTSPFPPDVLAAARPDRTDPAAPEFAATRDHNQAVTGDELRQIIERAEQLDAETRDIAAQRKSLFAEAKGRGFDTRVLRRLIALRRRPADEVAAEEAILEIYRAALDGTA